LKSFQLFLISECKYTALANDTTAQMNFVRAKVETYLAANELFSVMTGTFIDGDDLKGSFQSLKFYNTKKGCRQSFETSRHRIGEKNCNRLQRAGV
jgi:hypothetical protein